MDEGKRYSYTWEKAEKWEFCAVALIEQYKLRMYRWLLIGLICLVALFVAPLGAALLLVTALAMFTAVYLYSCNTVGKRMAGHTWTVWIEGDILHSTLVDHTQISCSRIEVIRQTGRLLMLGFMQPNEQFAWFAIPRRIFTEPGEEGRFIDRVRFPQAAGQDVGTDLEAVQEGSMQEPRCYTFTVDPESWICYQKDTIDILNGNVLGGSKRIKSVLLMSAVFLVVFLALACIAMKRIVSPFALLMPLLAVVLALRLFFRDPHKALKKQASKPAVRDSVCGQWQITLSDTCVAMQQPSGIQSTFQWDSFGWLVETGRAFYFFQKDRKHYVLLSKESFQTKDQILEMQQSCRQKGLVLVQGRAARYIPEWCFVLSGIVIFLLYVLIVYIEIIKGHSSVSAAEIYQEPAGIYQEPAAYDPDYVLHKEQVETLETLGSHVSVWTVDILCAQMEGYDVDPQTEGSPYMWPLSHLSPSEGTRSAWDVFWSDDEALDISTDYIEVLHGMLLLAEGSRLDSVGDIR